MHNGTLLVPKEKTRILMINPAVSAKTKAPILQNGLLIVAAEQQVVIQQRYSDAPENTQFNISLIDDSHKGSPKRIRQTYEDVEITDPGTVFSKSEFYHPSQASLFPRDDSPSMDEISQSQVGSCSLLAAIQGILNHPQGAAFIRGMMRRTADGRVVVRLFDPDTRQPVYISVPSVLLHCRGYLDDMHHRALWVHILENAYVAFGRRQADNPHDFLSIIPTVPWHGTVFGTPADVAFMVLAGMLRDPASSINAGETTHRFTEAQIASHLHVFRMSLQQGKVINCSATTDSAASPRLSTGHAYTLLAIFEKEVNGEMVPYVRLRNPHPVLAWFETEGDNQYRGAFEITAALFFQHFNNIVVVNPATRLFEFEQARLDQLNIIAQEGVVRSFRITKETKQDQIDSLVSIYNNFVTHLLKLEHIQAEQLFIPGAIDQIKRQCFSPSLSVDELRTPEHKAFVMRSFGELISPSSVALHSEEVMSRVYNILKLDWLTTHSAGRHVFSEEEIDELQQSIVQSAGYHFCERIHREKRKLDIMIRAHANPAMWRDGQIVIDNPEEQLLFSTPAAEDEAVTNRVRFLLLYGDHLLVAAMAISLTIFMILAPPVLFFGVGVGIIALACLWDLAEIDFFDFENPERSLVYEDSHSAVALSI